MSAFSPSLTLAGMDYITPSMECIKPTQAQATSAVVGRHPSHGGGESEPGKGLGGRQDVMKITLADCLACSGCVTTAETVLVEAQSRRELCSSLGLPPPRDEGDTQRPNRHNTEEPTAEERRARRRRPVLVTISEPSAASLAAHCAISVTEALHLVAGFMRAVLQGDDGEDAPQRLVYVSDLRWAVDLSAHLTTAEYQRRVTEGGPLPMLVSACPGWVCYCEKQGAALLPLLCPVLSPQGVAGSLAKRVVDGDLYHISLQPCFDRKLEAARDGYFPLPTGEGEAAAAAEPVMTPYTDCVLSTAELLEWMTETDATLPWRGRLDSDMSSLSSSTSGGGLAEEVTAATARMEGSGGYHRRVVEAVARAATVGSQEEDGGTVPARVDVTYEAKRNRNHQIASSSAITAAGGEGRKHCFCVAYGFQQIQNIVRGIKKNLPAARQYTFVELMACPDGCLNGGGQIRVASGDPQQHAAQLDKTEAAFTQYLSHTHQSSSGDHEENSREEEEEARTGKLFSRASLEAMLRTVGPFAFRCTFRDRQQEFEEMLNQGNIHSLKW